MAFGSVSDAAMGFSVKVRGMDKTMLHLQSLVPEVRAALEITIKADTQTVLGRARSLASGSVLTERTGKYIASIQSRVRSSDTRVVGAVFSNDPRADLFEFGGSTPARDILPNAKQAMRFAGGGMLGLLPSVGEVYAKIVHRPIVNYSRHSVIRQAFEDLEDTVEHDIRSASRSFVIDHGK